MPDNNAWEEVCPSNCNESISSGGLANTVCSPPTTSLCDVYATQSGAYSTYLDGTGISARPDSQVCEQWHESEVTECSAALEHTNVTILSPQPVTYNIPHITEDDVISIVVESDTSKIIPTRYNLSEYCVSPPSIRYYYPLATIAASINESGNTYILGHNTPELISSSYDNQNVNAFSLDTRWFGDPGQTEQENFNIDTLLTSTAYTTLTGSGLWLTPTPPPPAPPVANPITTGDSGHAYRPGRSSVVIRTWEWDPNSYAELISITVTGEGRDQNWGNRCGSTSVIVRNPNNEIIGRKQINLARSSQYQPFSYTLEKDGDGWKSYVNDQRISTIEIRAGAWWPGCEGMVRNVRTEINYE